MSLLGRLLSGAGAAVASSPRTNFDSNLEDQFTHNLLFPDPESLCHNDQVFPLTSGTILSPATITPFDINGEIDLEQRDVRVIIFQEGISQLSTSSQLLYDSHTPSPPEPTRTRKDSHHGASPNRTEGRRSISSPRKTSLGQNSKPVVIQQEAAAPRAFGGAFDRRPHNRNLSYQETEAQRSTREYREEITTFSNCVFGNSDILAYKGGGTKVHILPSESRTVLSSSSYLGDTNGSFGRSSMRGSKLAQSYTSDTLHGPTSGGFTSPSTSSTSTRGSERKKVLITRMFPVPLPNDDTEDVTQNTTPTPQTLQANETPGYPFPNVSENGMDPPEKPPRPLQKRTPMYAVGLVIQLPAAPHAPSAPTSRSSFRGPSSYNEQESFPSSYNSTKRSGWTMLGHGFGVESMDSSFSSDVDDRIDALTQHWDIISRTMSYLQSVATASLLPMLKQADISSPEPRRETFSHNRAPSASVSISGKRVLEEIKQFKIPKPNTKFVHLAANCLMQGRSIQKEVDLSRQRIVSGIKANQVVTGQGRWGIWREEARLVGKWAGGKDEGFFFFNLLTGFLGNHTEWLQALGPSWYRRRHYQQQRSNKDDDILLPARTVIVSDNKLMARRLIFLLSAFLPSNQQNAGMRHRPSTSTSFGGYSNSPPNCAVPILREESLRRRINGKRGHSRGVHSRTSSFPAQTFAPPAEIHHDRRTSDAASIRTASLPIPGSDLGARKSSAVTTSTITPATPAAHFSVGRPVRGTGPMPRPGSSGSLANEELQRTLHRGDSTASSDSQGHGSRWSVLSGFWGGSRRRESTASSSVEPLAVEGLEIHDPYYKGLKNHPRGNKLQEMVEEVVCTQKIKDPGLPGLPDRETRRSESGSATTARPEEDREHVDELPEQVIQIAERIPDPNGAFESPVKTSINEDDGVIDIDVPLPDYLAFETAVSSPSSSGYLSNPGLGGKFDGLDGFEQYSRSGTDMDTVLNVGGWLQHYHPDFALQAIPAHDNANIIEDVKASMRAEPTPLLSTTPQPENVKERWVDVCSALIADTTNFSIKHLRLRRLVRPKDVQHHEAHAKDSRYGNVYRDALLTPGVDVYESCGEERFVEEAIISMDEVLIEAVERCIAQGGRGGSGSSACSECDDATAGAGGGGGGGGVKEVPRGECKKTVLSALEEIVREVVDERGAGGGRTEREREKESFLREGVRGWLECVESVD